MASTPPSTPGRFKRFWLPVLIYVAIIGTLSSRPHLKPPFHFAYADKVAHMIEYAGLGFLLGRAWRVTLPGSIWRFTGLAVGSGIVVAVGDEFLQSFVPGRESTASDVAADALGLALAQLLFARRKA